MTEENQSIAPVVAVKKYYSSLKTVISNAVYVPFELVFCCKPEFERKMGFDGEPITTSWFEDLWAALLVFPSIIGFVVIFLFLIYMIFMFFALIIWCICLVFALLGTCFKNQKLVNYFVEVISTAVEFIPYIIIFTIVWIALLPLQVIVFVVAIFVVPVVYIVEFCQKDENDNESEIV